MLKQHRMRQVPEQERACEEDVFETTDFYLSCYLRCDGYRLIGIRREGSRSVFRFEDRADRRNAMLTFFNNEGAVRPPAYSAAIKDLKALIHNF